VDGAAVERPVWRRFAPRFVERAASWVRSGGHAAVVDGERVDVLLGATSGRITEPGLWSLLAIEQSRWRRVKEGPAEGLARARVHDAFAAVVLDWCERDETHEGPTRTLFLDCTACAACCMEANVVLGERDLDRFRRGGRPEIAQRAYVRRARDGRITLRFLPNGRCPHLGADRLCGIYEMRPDNCRVFPAGSEACLAAREDTLGWRDG
jgi:Fe-S-cluster containining protein